MRRQPDRVGRQVSGERSDGRDRDWDALSPQEKLEGPRGRYLVATALHYGVQQIQRFPDVRRADRDCADMLEILNGCFPQLAAQFRANDRRWGDIYKPQAVDAAFRPLGEPDPDE